MSEKPYDCIIIGAGIIGLSTAWHLKKANPGARVAILEKEGRIAAHQTGHNSGVIHSGIYYKPGTLKAKNCIAGVKELKLFCQERGIPYEECGKVVVATEEKEIPRLKELERRGLANGVEGLKFIGKEELREIEPKASGILALHSPKTAIVDFVRVASEYLKLFQDLGGEIFFAAEVRKIDPLKGVVESKNGTFKTRSLINCGGAWADRLGGTKEKILPFRGEYYTLKNKNLINGLIYPVPDPNFPFLGVHINRTIQGTVEAGPNAVLAFSKCGYRKSDVCPKDLFEILRYRGFWKMAKRYWKEGLYELHRSYSKKAFLKSLQKLVPSLMEKDLSAGGSGVRSQLVLPTGDLQDDFFIKEEKNILHVLNAPSPAATASIPIGRHLSGLIDGIN